MYSTLTLDPQGQVQILATAKKGGATLPLFTDTALTTAATLPLTFSTSTVLYTAEQGQVELVIERQDGTALETATVVLSPSANPVVKAVPTLEQLAAKGPGTIVDPLVLTAQTTGVGAPVAGGAGALPATPAGYLTVNINGTARQVPYY